jgi:hypothetical protein
MPRRFVPALCGDVKHLKGINMRYVKKSEVPGWLESVMDSCGSIDKTGSVRGMQNRFGWKRGAQVRVGGYIYNVGVPVVERLRQQRILRGEYWPARFSGAGPRGPVTVK